MYTPSPRVMTGMGFSVPRPPMRAKCIHRCRAAASAREPPPDCTEASWLVAVTNMSLLDARTSGVLREAQIDAAVRRIEPTGHEDRHRNGQPTEIATHRGADEQCRYRVDHAHRESG